MPVTWALVTTAELETVNVHIEELEAAGLLGLVEEDGRVTAYFPERRDDLTLEGRWEPVAERDWNAAWKAGIEPVTAGGITVTPPWIEVPGALVIEPAQAFGTGHHETTLGCLRALQEQEVEGRSVLDVGTGTGILALAAKRLGASDVLGVDTDPVAIAAARDNARANGLEVQFHEGSAGAGVTPRDIVLANLDTPTLTGMATDLAATVAAGGVLIASGVAVERSAEAEAALTAAGLAVRARQGAEWTVLLARPGAVTDR